MSAQQSIRLTALRLTDLLLGTETTTHENFNPHLMAAQY
jgi:hypothetical protein